MLVVHHLDPLLHDLVGRALQAQVQGGVHDQAFLVQVHGAQKLLLQALAHVLREVGSLVLPLEPGRGEVGARVVVAHPVVLEGALRLLPGRVAQGNHLGQDFLLQPLGPVGVVDGGVAAGGGQLDHQHGRFGHGQIARRVLEVELGSRLHPVGVVPEVHGVQVLLEDFVLREVALQLQRPPQLHQLALDGDVRAVGIEVAGQLLGEGRAAAEGAAGDDVQCGPDDVPQPEAAVFVEVAVLAGEQGVDQVAGHLVDGDQLPLLLGEELGHQLAVAIQDLGGQCRFVLLQGAGLLDVARGPQGQAQGDSQDHGDQKPGAQQDQGHQAAFFRHTRSRYGQACARVKADRAGKKGRFQRNRPSSKVSVDNIVNWEGNYIRYRHTYYRRYARKA